MKGLISTLGFRGFPAVILHASYVSYIHSCSMHMNECKKLVQTLFSLACIASVSVGFFAHLKHFLPFWTVVLPLPQFSCGQKRKKKGLNVPKSLRTALGSI